MHWYEAEVRALERTLEQSRAIGALPPRPAVFYGSSSIRGWHSLAADLGDPRALNLGFGGSTLEACLHFYARLVPALHPSSLVLYAGDNDLGDGRAPAQVADWLRRLLLDVERNPGPVPFGFISIKPSPARAGLLDRIRQTNEAIRREIARHPWAFYIDVFEPMLDRHGRVRPELFLPDGLHLAVPGYELWTRVLAAFRDRIFTEDCQASHTSVLSSDTDAPRVPPVVQSPPRP